MSRDSALFINIAYVFNAIDIIDCYIKSGLSIYDPEHKVRFVISDDDSFDWEDLSITYDKLKEIIEYKQKNGFPIGIYFFEGDICVTDLLITDSDTLIISCDVNRKIFKTVGRFEFTDVNWYIEKFIIPLIKNNFVIESFKYHEY